MSIARRLISQAFLTGGFLGLIHVPIVQAKSTGEMKCILQTYDIVLRRVGDAEIVERTNVMSKDFRQKVEVDVDPEEDPAELRGSSSEYAFQAFLDHGNIQFSELYLTMGSSEAASAFVNGSSSGLSLDSNLRKRGAQLVCQLNK